MSPSSARWPPRHTFARSLLAPVWSRREANRGGVAKRRPQQMGRRGSHEEVSQSSLCGNRHSHRSDRGCAVFHDALQGRSDPVAARAGRRPGAGGACEGDAASERPATRTARAGARRGPRRGSGSERSARPGRRHGSRSDHSARAERQPSCSYTWQVAPGGSTCCGAGTRSILHPERASRPKTWAVQRIFLARPIALTLQETKGTR
jgi:hypothetical protein